MPHPRTSPYHAAWWLWRHAARHRLTHPGTIVRRTVLVPARAQPSGARTEAVLATPPAARGWVILPQGADPAALAPLVPMLHRVGLGTLSLAPGADRADLAARTEALVEAARWLGRQPVVRAGHAGRAGQAGRDPWLALAGLGEDAAAVLAATASGGLPFGAALGIAGRYEGLDEAALRGLRAPLRLVAARDDATGIWQARQVLGWLAAELARDLVVVPGSPGGLSRAGARQARWLAGAWLLEQAAAEAGRSPAKARRAPALAALRVGATLLPLGVLMPMAWMAPQDGSGGTRGAQAAPARLWAGAGSADWRGGRLPALKLDAPLPGTIELSSLNGTNGFTSNGIASYDVSGRTVSDAGDVNGDGLGDVLIGARSGSYLVYGGAGVPAMVELSALNGTNGFLLNGAAGNSVSGAGDVNGDSFDDVLIGSYGVSPNGVFSGQSYVVYGGTGLPATVELSALNGSNGFRVNGVSSLDFSGRAVSGAGDVNGDGLGDIVIGASQASPNGIRSGQSYVVYGGTGLPATVELSALNGSNGFRVNGISSYDYAGRAVSGAGDVNGDELGDIVIGANQADPNGSLSGQSYVVYGGTALPPTVELSALNGSNGFRLNGILSYDEAGFSVSGAGDVNGDSLDDILIGAYRADPNGDFSGQSYVVYGGPALPATMELSALNGSNGFSLNGISSYDQAGFSVSGAGDVNGDSLGDILIGAPGAEPNGYGSGQSYLVYGGTGLPATMELSALNGTNGIRLNGISSYDQAGFSVSGAGDVNGDSFDDLVIGGPASPRGAFLLADSLEAPFDGPNGYASGQSYVVYANVGLPPTATPTPSANATSTPQLPTAARIARLAAQVAATGGVTVAWETASEVDVRGFNVYRAEGASERWSRLNALLIPARGSSAGGAAYGLADAPGVGAFRYRLEVVSASGAPEFHGPVEAVVWAVRAFLPWGER